MQRLYIEPLASYLRQRGHLVFQEWGFRRKISLWDLVSIFNTYQLLWSLKIDVLHVQTAKAGGIGRIAAWLAGFVTSDKVDR